jgi:hypothetical protein
LVNVSALTAALNVSLYNSAAQHETDPADQGFIGAELLKSITHARERGIVEGTLDV